MQLSLVDLFLSECKNGGWDWFCGIVICSVVWRGPEGLLAIRGIGRCWSRLLFSKWILFFSESDDDVQCFLMKKYLSFNEFESWSKLLFSKWILSVNESEWWSRLRIKEYLSVNVSLYQSAFFQPPVFLILRLYLVLDSALLKLSRFQWNKTSDLTALSLPCTVLEKSSF